MEGQKVELKMIRMSEVESQEVKWLWYPFIPYGKLTIIQGDPGDGKTTLVLNIAAKLSKGESLDSDMNVQKPVNVIYQTAEDGLADTVKPRLEVAGADCEKILVIDERDKSLSMADERLEEALAKTGAKVLILDPIQAYLGGGMDMNRANEARDMTKKLGALAEKYQCAILLIGHMNKAWGTGLPRIINRCKEYGLPEPLFEEFGDGFKVTIFRKVINAPEKVTNAPEKVTNAPEKVTNASEKVTNAFEKYLPMLEKAGATNIYIRNIEKVFACCGVDTPFGQANVMEWLKCSKSKARNVMNVLKTANVIEKVTGLGAGKYKFLKL